MTRTKIWRLSLAAILGFGWIFLTPAYSDDPLSLASQEISKLELDLNNLKDKAETKHLIDIAKYKYSLAVEFKSARDNSYSLYDQAVIAESTALSEKNRAQELVDQQTETVSQALAEKNSAKDLLDIANINLANTPVPSLGYQGVAFEIYPLSRSGNYAYIAPGSGLICQGGIPTFYTYAGDYRICGASQNIIGIFKATLTVPSNINDVYFAAYTDDGSRIYVNGVLEAEQWIEQGSTWGPYTRHFNTSVDKTLNLEVWWYNGGGPGNMTIGWGHSGIWTGIPNEYLSFGQGSSQEVIDSYNSAVAAQEEAQSVYNNKLNVYNSANAILISYNQELSEKINNYNISVDNTVSALSLKNSANEAYDQSIIDLNNAILDAKNEYNKQWKFEEDQRIAAEIATALANQPKSSPEPTVAPSPKPTPEQTKPNEPTQTPKPEITHEEKPTPQPSATLSPVPSPQTTDIDPISTTQPTVSPTKNPEIIKETPEKITTENISGILADITNKDTLTKLSSEQKIAIAGALGIKTNDLAVISALAKSSITVAQALEQFSDRAKDNEDAPMPYTLADATTEIAAEQFLTDPLGSLTNIDFDQVFDPSQWGKDMTDDQRKKAQEVVIPVIIASNIVAAAMTRRI